MLRRATLVAAVVVLGLRVMQGWAAAKKKPGAKQPGASRRASPGS